MFKIIHELVDVQTDVIRTGDSRTRGSRAVENQSEIANNDKFEKRN
jgi:hypothetical protein